MSSIEIMDATDIAALLPHRYPFLLVDRIEIVEPGREVVGIKRISAGEPWARGASPGSAVFPFSLVIEALAQTTGAIVRDLLTDSEGAVAYFMGATRVRLRKAARPGDELRLRLTLRQWRRGICRTHGVATVEGAVIATADLTTIARGA